MSEAWQADPVENGPFLIRSSARRYALGMIYREDDAHLISAAPELLEALRATSAALLDPGPCWEHGNAAFDQAQAAIAKAEGAADDSE